MTNAADARRSEAQFAWIGLGVINKLPERLKRRRGIYGENIRCGCDASDRAEISERIIRDVFYHVRPDRERRKTGKHDRVSVGRRFRYYFGAERSARATTVVNHDRLTEKLSHFLSEHPSHDVRHAACSIGHNEPDRPRRVCAY